MKTVTIPPHDYSLTHRVGGHRGCGTFTLREKGGEILVTGNSVLMLRTIRRMKLSIPEVMTGPDCWQTEWTVLW